MTAITSAETAAPRGAAVRVRPLGPKDSLKSFIDLQWRINLPDPQWIPPLPRMILKQKLKKHPFHQHSPVQLFVAVRDGAVVGRIAAIQNKRYNEFHGDKVGFFGLFECEDDPAVASALLDAAAAWLRERGLEVMRGPMSFSTNEEIQSPGILIDGFDTPPVMATSHNPPYYQALMEGAGLEKSKDLLAFWIPSAESTERLERGVSRLKQREGFTLRSVRMKELKAEIKRIFSVYNSAWERNWGFVPMTEEEFNYVANDFKQIVDPDLCLIAEKDGEPIGFGLTLPDINQAFKHLRDGRLFPLGIFKLLYHQRKIRTARVITLGMKPQYQTSGIGAALYLETLHVGKRKGYVAAEASWILEDNILMVRPLESLGATAYKRWRIYDQAL
jgi:GNAT superfamily N-acetyltransferase